MSYPKIFTHRNDRNSQVVIANAEQEAELPPEYLPEVAGVAGRAISGADHVADAMLSPEYDALLAEREKLEQDRAELAVARAELEKDRHELTEGYKGAVAQFEAERAAWEASKFAQAPEGTQENVSATPVDEQEPDQAAPSKRARVPKAD